MRVMSLRLYCFRQPSELQPSARSLEELQMESITIYFDAWESLDIDLGWWQFPRKGWGNPSEQCAGAICYVLSLLSAIKRIRNSQGHNGVPPLFWQSTIEMLVMDLLGDGYFSFPSYTVPWCCYDTVLVSHKQLKVRSVPGGLGGVFCAWKILMRCFSTSLLVPAGLLKEWDVEWIDGWAGGYFE